MCFSSTDKIYRTCLHICLNCFRTYLLTSNGNITGRQQSCPVALRWRQCCTSDRLTWKKLPEESSKNPGRF